LENINLTLPISDDFPLTDLRLKDFLLQDSKA